MLVRPEVKQHTYWWHLTAHDMIVSANRFRFLSRMTTPYRSGCTECTWQAWWVIHLAELWTTTGAFYGSLDLQWMFTGEVLERTLVHSQRRAGRWVPFCWSRASSGGKECFIAGGAVFLSIPYKSRGFPSCIRIHSKRTAGWSSLRDEQLHGARSACRSLLDILRWKSK